MSTQVVKETKFYVSHNGKTYKYTERLEELTMEKSSIVIDLTGDDEKAPIIIDLTNDDDIPNTQKQSSPSSQYASEQLYEIYSQLMNF